MSRTPRSLALLVLALVAALPVAADPPAIMPVSEVKRGMKGYGKSVFSGTTVEKFDVEVVDVLRKFLPGMDLILIRVSHPVTDKANVIGGMSGSPIFLDDKLVGALAYGWSFSKEPLCGVTPIEAMLAEGKRPALISVMDWTPLAFSVRSILKAPEAFLSSARIAFEHTSTTRGSKTVLARAAIEEARLSWLPVVK